MERSTGKTKASFPNSVLTQGHWKVVLGVKAIMTFKTSDQISAQVRRRWPLKAFVNNILKREYNLQEKTIKKFFKYIT